jgi:sterol desaturase/sphingolipid hydroxylase (fatty acid hydroxylase superfamily)
MTVLQDLAPYAAPLRVLGLFAGALTICLVAEKLAPARREPSAGRGLNLGIGLFSLVIVGVSSSSVGALATLAVNAAGGGWIVLPTTGWGFLAGCAAYLVAMDLGEYLFHRAQHAIPALWAMHSLHHSDPDFGTTTTVRHFWLDPLIKTLTIWLAVGLLFKASPAIAGVYAVIGHYNYWTHSNVRVGYGRAAWLWNSPQYHRMHHSADPAHFNSNYAALLPIFDVLSGAYKPPKPGEYPATGLDTGERPQSFLQAVTWPLRAKPAASTLVRPTS